LPRSGSTLIEQILASHSQIEGTQELPDIQRIVLDLERCPAGYPGVLAELTAEQLRGLGERYLEGARAYRRTQRPFFIDKMPNNFRNIGLEAGVAYGENGTMRAGMGADAGDFDGDGRLDLVIPNVQHEPTSL